ncbi:hypothetical protein SASPL_102906 [Salvia splendens]|uniref:Pathogenesis-related protein 5 n=1 Tax=Salvia splendens TaxID=180675 RepID=A0A8X8YXJ8_SALSN|nr:hypothetical protein SASPL_102906 [Salvia splendens]
MVCFCFLVDQTRKVRQQKPAAGICSRCGGGASVADMKTATRFCYVPFYWKTWRAISMILLPSSTPFVGKLSISSGAIFTLQNSCSYTIWPGTLSGNGAAVLGGGGFALPPGGTIQLPAPPGWSGRVWARTGCNFDAAGNGQCATGDCGGGIKCIGGGAPPASLVEFTLGGDAAAKDFYDVSLVDGYNVGLGVRPSGGTGDCQNAGCVTDLNASCPNELRVETGGAVVACKSACAAFNTPVVATTQLRISARRRSTRGFSRRRALRRIATLAKDDIMAIARRVDVIDFQFILKLVIVLSTYCPEIQTL